MNITDRITKEQIVNYHLSKLKGHFTESFVNELLCHILINYNYDQKLMLTKIQQFLIENGDND